MDLDAVVANLNKRRFLAQSFPTNEALKDAALAIVGAKSVGIGGSASVAELGLYETLIERGNAVYAHTYTEHKDRARRNAMNADVYLCSANAITEAGLIVNIDGTGNRIAATVFGPKTVIVIAGRNKLTPDVESGIARTRRESCPRNAERLGFKTPCALTGVCGDCQTPARMCNALTLLWYPTRRTEAFHVLISEETLGW